jgi:CRP-like cAMP-binding protein
MSRYSAIAQKLIPLSNGKIITINKGALLFNQGEVVRSIYLLVNGRIKLVRETVDGNPVVLHVALANESFAEASLFATKYHCSAIADCASELIRIEKSELLSQLSASSTLSLELLELFSSQVRDLRTLMEIRNIRSAVDRVMTYLKFESSGNDYVEINTPLKDIAYRLGLAHESFYRALSHLESKDLIKKTASKIFFI